MADSAKKPAKKTTAKKTTARKTAAKKPAAKRKTAAKKTTAKKAAAKPAKPAKPVKMGATRAAATTTGEFRDKATDKVRSVANQGKDRTGEAIGGLGKMIEDSAQTIDDNVGEKYGDYARSAADAVSSFADKINSKDVDEMVDDARGFVRKKPAIAIGAAAVAGFLLSRLIKSGMDDES